MPRSDQYLLIQNKGEAPVEGYTVLGYSSTRNCGVDGVIGQFGSGSKHAINLCLRNGLPVWVYCGTTRLEFALEEEVINDGLRDETVYHVVYRKGNGPSKRAGWILDFGILDWDNVGMAVREFVSNAIDRTLREEGSVQVARTDGRLTVKIVDDSDRRGKSGYTRIYIAVNDEIREYFGQLGKRFLHFSDRPEEARPGLLPKANRNLTDGNQAAVIYREGVYVREIDGVPSLYDYNLSKDEVKIDECRNSSSYYIKAACARKLGSADAAVLASIFSNEITGNVTFESGLDQDYIFGDYVARPTETQQEVWRRAWEAAAGPDAVVCESSLSSDYVQRKGYKSKIVTSRWATSLGKIVKSVHTVLTADEQRGCEPLEATIDAQKAVDWAWDLANLVGLAGNREKPPVFCFRALMAADVIKHGFKNEEGIHINIDFANNGQNNELRKTALEEVAHWITGATDSSRDFQNFFIDALVALAT